MVWHLMLSWFKTSKWLLSCTVMGWNTYFEKSIISFVDKQVTMIKCSNNRVCMLKHSLKPYNFRLLAHLLTPEYNMQSTTWRNNVQIQAKVEISIEYWTEISSCMGTWMYIFWIFLAASFDYNWRRLDQVL